MTLDNPIAQPNVDRFRALLDEGALNLQPAPWLNVAPAPIPDLTWDRLSGMLLGLALGDALGRPTESMTPAKRDANYGQVRGMMTTRRRGVSDTLGLTSDDTQMAFWLLEHLRLFGDPNPRSGDSIPTYGCVALEGLVHAFVDRPIRGMGQSVRAFRKNAKRGLGGDRWARCGVPSAGNGALMRIAPALVPHVHRPTAALWADVALAGAITHNDAASNASCLAFVAMLWELLSADAPPAQDWWLDRFLTLARPVEGDAPQYKARGGAWTHLEPSTLCDYTEHVVRDAITRDLSTRDACDGWHSGAYLLETVPCALYILRRYAHDPAEAILRAVNDTKDNDTCAAIVGAAVGALYGASTLPEAWINDLNGNLVRGGSDRAIFELLDTIQTQLFDPSKPVKEPAP